MAVRGRTLRRLFLTSLVVALASVVTPTAAFAQSNDPFLLALPAPLTNLKLFQNLGSTIGPLWDIAILASAVVFLVLLLVGGIQYLTSAGNDEQSKKAKTLLTEAVIGIVLVIIAWPVGVYILRLLGISRPITGDKPIAQMSTSSSTGVASSNHSTGTLVVQLAEATPNVKLILVSADTTAFKAGGAVVLAAQQQMAVTGPDGRATFLSVPEGPATIYERTTSSRPIGEAVVVQGQTTTVTVSRSDTLVSVSLTFLDNQTLKPVPNLLFSIRQGGTTIVDKSSSDASGTASVTLPAGKTVSIVDVASGGILQSETVPTDNGRTWTIYLALHKVAFHFFFTKNGQPASGVAVTIKDFDKVVMSGATDVNGRITATNVSPTDLLEVFVGEQFVCSATVPPQNANSTTCDLGSSTSGGTSR